MEGITTLNLTFVEKDFEKLKQAKMKFGSKAKNWEEFILALIKR